MRKLLVVAGAAVALGGGAAEMLSPVERTIDTRYGAVGEQVSAAERVIDTRRVERFSADEGEINTWPPEGTILIVR